MSDVAQIFKGQGLIQNWYVRRVSPNGRILSVTQGYASKWGAKRAARRQYPDLPIKDVSK